MLTEKQNYFRQVLSNTRKIFRGKPTITYRKELNSPYWWRGSLAMQLSFPRSSPSPRDLLPWLALIWAQQGLYSGSSPSGPLGSTGANKVPLHPGPAALPHQVLHQQFKPWPHSDPILNKGSSILICRRTSLWSGRWSSGTAQRGGEVSYGNIQEPAGHQPVQHTVGTCFAGGWTQWSLDVPSSRIPVILWYVSITTSRRKKSSCKKTTDFLMQTLQPILLKSSMKQLAWGKNLVSHSQVNDHNSPASETIFLQEVKQEDLSRLQWVPYRLNPAR